MKPHPYLSTLSKRIKPLTTSTKLSTSKQKSCNCRLAWSKVKTKSPSSRKIWKLSSSATCPKRSNKLMSVFVRLSRQCSSALACSRSQKFKEVPYHPISRVCGRSCLGLATPSKRCKVSSATSRNNWRAPKNQPWLSERRPGSESPNSKMSSVVIRKCSLGCRLSTTKSCSN